MSRFLPFALVVVAACSKKSADVPYGDYVTAQAAKTTALENHIAGAIAAVATGGEAPGASECAALGLVLNGKEAAGNTEILWADDALDVVKQTKPRDPATDPHFIWAPDVTGWCQLLESTFYWLGPKGGQTDLGRTGVGPPVSGWIESALDLKYLVLMQPGAARRGEQDLRLTVVELATGKARCSATVTGHADPSLGVEHYDLVRKSTGQKVGTDVVDNYRQAMKTDLRTRVDEALRTVLHIDMRSFCAHP